ncbi:MAG: orotate phosphoribosyltransferase [Myxococcota bacterium]
MSSRERLLEMLRERSFDRRTVTLASGKTSDWFIDCKQTVLTAVGHRLAGELLLGEARRNKPDAVAGVALGGCPLASAVAMMSLEAGSPLDALYVRKGAKDHGSKRNIEGDDRLAKGARIVMLEDVVTTGGSTLDAVAELRSKGYEVVGVVALVDREEGGRDRLSAASLEFSSVFRRADFMPG